MTEESLRLFKEDYQEWKEVMAEYNALLLKKKNSKNIEKIEQINNDIMKLRKSKGPILDLTDEEALIYFGNNPWMNNNIYVCVGEYAKMQQAKWDCKNKSFVETRGYMPDRSKLLPLNSSNGFFRKYMNLESDYNSVVLEKTNNEFENNNIVFYPGEENALDFYKRVRLLFFKTCIENNQEEAIAKVLELKK